MTASVRQTSTTLPAQDMLSHNHDLLLGLGRAAQAAQQAHTADEIYRAVGDQIKFLGCEVTLLMANDDRQSFTAAYTSYAPTLLRKIEKLTGFSILKYRIVFPPESIYARNMAAGETEYVHWANEHIAQALPAALRPLSDQFMSILKIEQGILAPLHVEGETLGLMMVSGLDLNESDVPAMQSFAGQIATGLHNVRLMQKLQDELSARKQAEERLKISFSTFEGIFNSITEAIYILDENGIFLNVNLGAEKMYGYPPEYFIGRTPEFLSAPGKNDTVKVVEFIRQSYLGETVEFEFWGLRKNGSIFPKEVRLTPGVYFGRNVVIAVGRDITERKQAEEAIRQTERHFKALIEKAPDGIALVGLDGKTNYASPSARNIFGYDSDDGINTNPLEFIHPDDLTIVIGAMNDLVQNPAYTPTLEYRYKHKDDSYHWVESTFSNLLAEPSVQAVVINFRDITKRKLVEEALMQSEARYRLLADHTTDTIWLTDLNLKTTYISPSVEKIRGYTLEQLQELPLDQNIAPRSFQLAMELLSVELPKALADSQYLPVHTLELEFFNQDGTIYSTESKLSLIRDESGNPISILGESRDIAERKRIEKALFESERYYRALIENATDGVLVLNADGKIRYESPSVARMLGYGPDALIGASAFDLINPDDLAQIASAFMEGLSTPGFVHCGEYRLRHCSGEWRYFEIISRYLMDDPVVAGIIINGRDITERKQSEVDLLESQLRYQRLADHAPDIIFRYDFHPTMQLTYINPAVQLITGYTQDECYADPNLMLSMVHPDDLNLMAGYMQSLTPPSDPMFMRWIGKDGVTRWMESRIVPVLDADGQLVAVEGITRDVTERKKAEEALRESESKFHSVIAESADGIVLTDESGRIIEFNNATEQITCHKREMALGQFLWDFQFSIMPKHSQKNGHYPQVKEAIQKALENGQSPFLYKTLEAPIEHPDGSVRFIQQNVFSIHTEKGWRLGSITRDVTEHKQVEKALQASEERYRVLYEDNPSMYFTADANGLILSVNKFGIEQLGYGTEELVGQPLFNIFHPDDRTSVEGQFTACLHNLKQSIQIEARKIRKDGTTLWVRESACAVQDIHGQVIVLLTCDDVTERKQAEESLRASEEKSKSLYQMLRLMTDNLPDLVWAKDMEGRYTFANKAMVEKLLIAQDTEEPIGKTDLFFAERQINSRPDNPDWHTFGEICIDTDTVIYAKKHAERFEEFGNVKGEFLFLDVYKAPFLDEQGNMIGTVGIGRDVTHEKKLEEERKQIQEALAASEAELRALFTSIQDAVLVIDRNGFYRKIAPTNPDKSYIAPEEVVGKRLTDFFPAKQVETFISTIQQVLETQKTLQVEYEIVVNGQSPWFEASISPLDADSTLWVARDISERKQVEAKLYLQSAALEAAANTIVITDRDGIIQWANSSFTSLTGFDATEATGKKPSELIKSGKQSQQFYQDLWDTILSGKTWHNELINRRKDGNLYVEEMTITPLRDLEGRVSHFIAVKQDITERKQAEMALIQSEMAYRALFENMPIGLYRTSADGKLLDANPALVNMFGWPDRSSLLGRTAQDLYADPVSNDRFKAEISTKGVISAFEAEFHRYDQQTFWAEDYVHIIRDEAGNPLYYEGSLINITERKRAEDELRRANQSLEAAHNELKQMFEHEQVLARTDGLTGLCNRRYFFELATRELHAAIRYHRPLTIILFDVDGFKQVNDTFGHALGDAILIQIAQASALQVRDVDVLARYGGDEFIILLPQTNAQQAFLIAERIRESVATTRMETDKSPFIVTLSIGVAEAVHMPQDASVEDVIRRADQALYLSKQKGRNNTVIYTET